MAECSSEDIDTCRSEGSDSRIQDIFPEDLSALDVEQCIWPDEARKGLQRYDRFATEAVYCNWNVQC